MKRDKRKGLMAGYKKLGPTKRFLLSLSVVGFFITIVSFVFQTSTGPTKANQLRIIKSLDTETNTPAPPSSEELEKLPASELASPQNVQPESLNPMTKNTGKPYERFIYELYTALTKDDRFTSVEKDVMLEGKDGYRQIDVLMRAHVANADLLIVIECRDHGKRLDILLRA